MSAMKVSIVHEKKSSPCFGGWQKVYAKNGIYEHLTLHMVPDEYFFPLPAHHTLLAYSFFAQQRLKCPGLLKNCSHLHIHTVMYFLFYFNWKTHQTSPKSLTPSTFTSTTHFLYSTFLFALRFSLSTPSS